MPQKDFDLSLPSLWFTSMPPKFPVPSMRDKGPATSTYTWEYEQDYHGTRKTLICAARFLDDLSTTKVKATWTESDPLGTVKAEQKHLPPPAMLSEEELDQAHKLYGANIAAWAEGAVGQTIGDGECWTLIHHALLDLAESYARYGKEPPLLSQGRSHGHCILFLRASSPGSNEGLLQLADVRPGDILEMESAHFKIIEPAPVVAELEYGKWTKGAGEKNVRMANHTAIVVRGVEGDVLKVVEQNGTVPKEVAIGGYDMGTMQEGTIRVFRVIGENWMKPLEARWD